MSAVGSSSNSSGGGLIVKKDWTELSEEDKTDIKKVDKSLNDLLSEDKPSQSFYELILEYMLGKAHLSKFIAMHLNTQSTSKTKNKMRIIFLIHKLILEKDSEKKQAMVIAIDEYLCAIYFNVFREYVKDAAMLDKLKMMRLIWVEKIPAATFDKIRQEIGNHFLQDIDIGLSSESLDKV